MPREIGSAARLPPSPHEVYKMRPWIPDPWGSWPVGPGNRGHPGPLVLYHLWL